MQQFQWNQNFNLIVAMPACGKTTMAKKYSNITDLECNPFKNLDYDPLREENQKTLSYANPNPFYPQNYLRAIKKSVNEKNKLIFLPPVVILEHSMMSEIYKFSPKIRHCFSRDQRKGNHAASLRGTRK
jgi:hypothetical protein